jgi:hypothetical protein
VVKLGKSLALVTAMSAKSLCLIVLLAFTILLNGSVTYALTCKEIFASETKKAEPRTSTVPRKKEIRRNEQLVNLFGNKVDRSDPFVEELQAAIKKDPEIVTRFREILRAKRLAVPKLTKLPPKYRVVYHGTTAEAAKSIAENGPASSDGVMYLGRGFFTTDDVSIARSYAQTIVHTHTQNIYYYDGARGGKKKPRTPQEFENLTDNFTPVVLAVELRPESNYLDLTYRLEHSTAYDWFLERSDRYQLYEKVVSPEFAKKYFSSENSPYNATTWSAFATLLGADVLRLTHREPGVHHSRAYEDQLLVLNPEATIERLEVQETLQPAISPNLIERMRHEAYGIPLEVEPPRRVIRD